MRPSLVLPFHDVFPTFAGEPLAAGPRSAVLGRATIGAGAAFGEDCVVRADGEEVRIGDDVFLGHRATVHIVHEQLPAVIGRQVTVGENSIVHACTVGDGCVIDRDVTILDGAKIGAGALIEPRSTVFPRKVLAGGMIYSGSPAVAVRELKPGELGERAEVIRGRNGSERALSDAVPQFGDDVFIAGTAQRAGRLSLAPLSSLFFSCLADAGMGSISIGANTNIQDNSVIRAGSGETVVGRDVTVGHNVHMGAVRIGDNVLVGMGAALADGTVIESDVLLAAGSLTEPGQVLGSGWLWGGRPAKRMSRLDDARRAGMAENVRQYVEYSQTFRRIQARGI